MIMYNYQRNNQNSGDSEASAAELHGQTWMHGKHRQTKMHGTTIPCLPAENPLKKHMVACSILQNSWIYCTNNGPFPMAEELPGKRPRAGTDLKIIVDDGELEVGELLPGRRYAV